MFTYADSASKCNANSYRYRYAYDYSHRYAKADDGSLNHPENAGGESNRHE